MRNAIVENGIVVNVTVGEKLDDAWVDCSDDVGIGWVYDGVEFLAPVPVATPTPAPIVNVWEWYIDLGPFFDRFDTAKTAVLTSADAGVKAILEDVKIRKWIDLQRADVASSLAYIGTKVPALDSALQAAILTTPVASEENLALRKLYFS
jgi:hypothetical protein